jgi:hypothetical protein
VWRDSLVGEGGLSRYCGGSGGTLYGNAACLGGEGGALPATEVCAEGIHPARGSERTEALALRGEIGVGVPVCAKGGCGYPYCRLS